MKLPQKVRWRWPLAGAFAFSMVLTMGAVSAGAVEQGPAPAPTATGNGQVLTLITGDKVLVEQLPGGLTAATVEPAQRAGEISFQTITHDEQTYVIPSDAAALIPEVLDRELFNVTKLADYGYYDGVPVIKGYGQNLLRPLSVVQGTSFTRDLPSIDAVAATIDANGQWWDAATSSRSVSSMSGGALAGGALAGVDKIWLDELAEVQLEDSVPLVGAPAAWDAGYDGAGITVAVLDTGVDEAHPDLVGQVTASENFTDDVGTGDEHGHGTHVAGTVAGIGAASGGAHVGVAPGAQLLNGKVCNRLGNCPQSAVIAGMEWAASQGADVVNVSIGGDATDGTDPLSAAVDNLTEQYGVLYVVSAGNDGLMGDHSVTAPGAAAAALTVGSVNKSEQLDGSSSRGPRLGDFTIKPDITAPGVSIVAPRAAGTHMGVPVDDDYTAANGTSMAAPHVAGAAAIVLQHSPELDWAELKALLSSTAVPNDDYDVYQQGGGRLDIPSTLDSPVLATPSPLDLGYFEYPHDDVEPVTAEVTYTNRTDEQITLDLSLAVTSREGDTAGSDMLSVSPETVTINAGASAQVAVTVDVREGELGLYGGYLTASAGDEVITRTPVGFHKEPEMYDLTVEGIARDGRPAAGISAFHLLDVHDTRNFLEMNNRFSDGTATLRVPPSTYHVMGIVYTYDGTITFTQERVMVGEPEVQVTDDTTVLLDARDAIPLQFETPDHPDAAPIGTGRVSFYREAEDVGAFIGSWIEAWQPTFVVETDPVTIGEFEFNSTTRLGLPPVTLDVVEPVAQKLAPREMLGSPPLDEELHLPVVWAGLGQHSDYEDLDVEGAAVLTRRGGPGNAAKEAAARANGAAAIMIMNSTSGNFSGWAGDNAEIPTMTLSMEDGDLLLDLLDDDDVTVRLWGVPETPIIYDTTLAESDRLPGELNYVLKTDKMATLVNHFHSDVDDHEMGEVRNRWRPHEVQAVALMDGVDVPRDRTEYVVAGDTRYQQSLYAERPFTAQIQELITTYDGTEHVDQSWFKSPARPGVLAGGPHEPATPVVRDGDMLDLMLNEWSGSHPGHWGWMQPGIDTSEFRIYQDGELIAEADRPRGEFPLSQDPAEYRLELDLRRDAEWWKTSTQTQTAWTLQSQQPAAGAEVVPLLLVDYDIALDLSNTAPHPRDLRGPATLDLQVGHQAGVVDPAAIAGADVWVSFDDGDTWQSRPVQSQGDGGYQVVLPQRGPGQGAGYVSLRVHAWDADDNQIEQEITRAWKLSER